MDVIKPIPVRNECPIDGCTWSNRSTAPDLLSKVDLASETEFVEHLRAEHREVRADAAPGEVHTLRATFLAPDGRTVTGSFDVDNAYRRAFCGDLGVYLEWRHLRVVRSRLGRNFTQMAPWAVDTVRS